MKQIIIGTLAHVDAGKTTLSESMLYLSGSIRKMGRVDHKDAFLDFDHQERKRGITIFSKQAILNWKECEMTIVDTPGHVDFSTEMERTLQILDYAILVINGLDGVQAHSETIWQLLKHYQIPTFIFINKMDITHYEQTQLMNDIEKKLSEKCVDFTLSDEERDEKISMCDDELLEHYLEKMSIDDELLIDAISQRKVFPCFFGSALKMKNVDKLLDGLSKYTKNKTYPSEFGAKVYKISRDEQGNQLTHMKITGGSLKVKTKLQHDEKVDQIRKYSGSKYQVVDEVFAGSVCAIKGLRNIFSGEGLGIEGNSQQPVLSSYMNYRVILKDGIDVHTAMKNFVQLSQEDPQLHVRFHNDEITLQLMGEIQTEVLKNLVKERFDMDIDFDQGSVIYKETITKTVEGVGHYEPLRHYAEVHLLLEPLDRGSGIQIHSDCSEDILSRNWQRLILSHIEEKEHIGVLAGYPITDMKITLLTGKAHLKHTEGGDFRQATYRAIRHGLKSTESILLEPYYQFRLEVPNEYLSKAIYDIEAMHGSFTISDQQSDIAIIKGSAPVARMQNYQNEVINYTKGKGKLFCALKGYEPCENAKEIIDEINYDSERDIDNPTGSVFCAHGAGFNVKWDEVVNHMHLKACWKEINNDNETNQLQHNPIKIDDAELERVMTRTYGPDKTKLRNQKSRVHENKEKITFIDRKPNCLLVDGYNMIYSWDNLKELAKDNLDAAREKLIHMMSSYQGYKKCLLILVFDAYKVADGIGSSTYNGSIHIVYTKKAQTADTYIEKTTHELSSQYNITVATSDGLEQLIVSGQGARRMSSKELKQEVEFLSKNRMQEYETSNRKGYAKPLEKIRKLNEEE